MPVIPKEKWDSIEQYLEYLRHVAGYALFAQDFVGAKDVLEIGCGAGYGAGYLSESASHITAVDISNEGVSQYWDKYTRGNLHFLLGDGTHIPFKHSSFDVVMSFQVIEHIEPKFVLGYLREIRRVLRTGGTFICSTPNKRLRLLPFQKPWNPEHRREYRNDDLKNLLTEVFERVEVYGLCGSDEIQANVRNGLKQSPFNVYIERPIYRLLIYLLPPPVLVRLRKTRQRSAKRRTDYKPVPQETPVSKFSVNDFRVDPSCPKDCLDLYGVCTKARQ
jgi:ubiquinone/menaquinone biosynthesis C-methylase UbiE